MPDERRAAGPAVGDRLPGATVATVAGPSVDLHLFRHAGVVLVFPHPACAGCQDELRRLDDARGRFEAWGGQLLACPDEAAAPDLDGRVSLPVLLDAGARVRSGLGLDEDVAGVVVADRYGTIYRYDRPGRDHRFPTLEDLLEEVRFIGMQCPECGVPDDPLRGEEAWSR